MQPAVSTWLKLQVLIKRFTAVEKPLFIKLVAFHLPRQ
jgi:hypothetical protein